MRNTRNIVLCGLLTAIGIVLPAAVRLIPNGGILFSPMHIPALLAGIVLGPMEGLIVGIACPLLNNLLFGMPQGVTLIGMCVELPVYGIAGGVFMHVFRQQKDGIRVYSALILAMILGRIAGGITQTVVLGIGSYSLTMWASSYFVATAPAIVIHLILIPSVYYALQKANLVKKTNV
jgi:riboflavin transporter FmnP